MKFWKIVLVLPFALKLQGVNGGRSLALWTQWSPCTVSCGCGVQRREQTCAYASAVCRTRTSLRFASETRLCEARPCYSKAEGLLRRNKNNIALKNHLIKERLVCSEIECALFCSRDTECLSINVAGIKDPDTGGDKRGCVPQLLCQINNSTDVLHPDDLVFRHASRYYSIISRKLQN